MQEDAAAQHPVGPRDWPLLVTIAIGLAASVALIVAVYRTDYIPTVDGPQHIYLAHVENHFSDPGTAYASYYNPGVPLTSLGFALIYAPLATLMHWQAALRIATCVMVLLWSWGAVMFARAVHPGRVWLGLLGFASAFQWALYMGFYSYYAGAALGLFVLAIAVQTDRWTWSRRVAIAGLLLGQAVFHVFGAEVSALVLIALVLARHPVRAWPKELGLLAVMGLPTMFIAAYAAGLIGDRSLVLPHQATGSSYADFWVRVQLVGRAFVSGPHWRSWPVVAAGLTAFTFLGRRVLHARRGKADPALRTDLGLAAASVVLLALGLTLPLHMSNWQFASPRFLPYGVMLAVMVLPVERISGVAWRGLAIASASGFAFAAIAWSAWFHTHLRDCMEPLHAGLTAPIVRSGPRLPVILRTTCGPRVDFSLQRVPFHEPGLNVAALYAVEQGGLVPYTFTSLPQLHSFVFSEEGWKRFPRTPDRREYWLSLMAPDFPGPARADMLDRLAWHGAAFEDVLFYGSAEDRQAFVARGFRTAWEKDRLWMGEFEGCPTKLELDVGADWAAPVVTQLGWFPGSAPDLSRELEPGGPASLVLEGAPCGRVWLRIWLDADRSGTLDRGERVCVGTKDGETRLQLRRGLETIRCVVER